MVFMCQSKTILQKHCMPKASSSNSLDMSVWISNTEQLEKTYAMASSGTGLHRPASAFNKVRASGKKHM